MKNNKSNIKKSINLLKKNECVGIPTETVYGLAANAYSDEATSKIFKLKKRPTNNSLIVHYYNLSSLKKDCGWVPHYKFKTMIKKLINDELISLKPGID